MTQDDYRGARGGEVPPLWRYHLRRGGSVAVWSRRHAEASLIARAAKDEDFRRALLADPLAAIAVELGVRLPAGTTYTVRADSDEVLHLVLPARPQGAASGAPAGATLDDEARWAVDEQPTTLLERETAAAVVARAWGDASFLAALRDGAREALEETFGVRFDAGCRVALVEETERALTLVLPSLRVGAPAGSAWREDEDELMMHILATPCMQTGTHDPCPAGSAIDI